MRVSISTKQRGKFALTFLTVFSHALPEEFIGFRAVQLSDLHLGPATSLEHLEEGFRIVEQLQPDSLFLTGDYVQNTRSGLTQLLGTRVQPKVFRWTSYRRQVRALAKELGILLSRIDTRDGIFAVLGNHDYLEGPGSIRRMFPEHVHWLFNDQHKIVRGNSALHILGVDDYQKGTPSLSRTMTDDLEKDPFRILLSHNPDIVLADDAHKLDSVQLILCGHTHGGQICLPFIGPLTTRTKQSKHTSGLSYRNKTAIYVNSGLGYGLVGLRLLCPPEITIIEFKRE